MKEMIEKLKEKYGDKIEVRKAIHLHDEYEWNEYAITYDNIIVGSELVDFDFIDNYIQKYCL